MNNINTTGTFTEYMDSIVAEIRRHAPRNYSVNVQDNFWGIAKAEDGGTSCKVIFICEINDGPNINFSIAKLEFMTLQQYTPDALVDLATTRFRDATDSLKSLRDEFSEAIKRFEVAI